MRVYLEAVEVPPEGAPEDYQPDFIRLDATGKRIDDVLAVLESLLDPNRKYIIRKHICRHDETPKKSCSVEVMRIV